MSVACVVLREHPEEPVLILRRAFGKFKHKWCIVTGRVEAGEAPPEAARREVSEETGLVTRELAFLHSARGRAASVQQVFVVRVTAASEVRLNSEHTSWRWVSFAEAEAQLAPPGQRRAIRLAQEQVEAAIVRG